MRVRLLTLAALFTLGAAVPASAQIKIGPELAWGDDSDFGLGARVVWGMDQVFGAPLDLHAHFDYFFPDEGGGGADVNYWELNGNLAYRIPVRSTAIRPYAGAGLNIAHVSVDVAGGGSADDTDLGLNLLGGMQFKTSGRILPFVELRIELEGGDQFVLAGGVLF